MIRVNAGWVRSPRSQFNRVELDRRSTSGGGRPADAGTPSAPTDCGARPPARAQPDRIVPLTADLRRLHLTVSKRLLDKLDAARDALSHSHPGASVAEILETALDLVLERHAKRRGIVKKPRAVPPPSTTDAIPAHVKREVWLRDGGRCQYPLASGGVCGSTVRVQFHHEEPRARGGPPIAANVSLRCHVHNDLEAREDFGDAWMDQFTRGPGARTGGPRTGGARADGARARGAGADAVRADGARADGARAERERAEPAPRAGRSLAAARARAVAAAT